jgi:hypothetical protein
MLLSIATADDTVHADATHVQDATTAPTKKSSSSKNIKRTPMKSLNNTKAETTASESKPPAKNSSSRSKSKPNNE